MKKTIAMCLSILLLLTPAACASNQTPQGNGTFEPPPTSESGEPTAAPPSASEESKSDPSATPVENVDEQAEQANSETNNILVAYFSHSGNTQTIAEIIHEQVGGDIFEIKTVTTYSSDYNTVLDEAQQEKRDDVRPELSKHVENMEDYDTVFIGFPNWWGDMPMAVYSFLEGYDFAGKTVIPFCTHGGSGFSGTENTLEQLLSEATLLKGVDVRDSGIDNAQDKITDWLRELEIIE